MADAASTLRTARAAMQEGLITEGDYEVVKAAFLKAQQFKAGLDAGFISEADYADVKTRFLDSFYGLNVSDGSGVATPQRAASPALEQPAATAGEGCGAVHQISQVVSHHRAGATPQLPAAQPHRCTQALRRGAAQQQLHLLVSGCGGCLRQTDAYSLAVRSAGVKIISLIHGAPVASAWLSNTCQCPAVVACRDNAGRQPAASTAAGVAAALAAWQVRCSAACAGGRA